MPPLNTQPAVITRETLSDIFSLPAFILPVFKEVGYSSGFFVNQVRKRLTHARKNKKFKVGHAGTLDPFAEGVLILLCGKATTHQDNWMRKTKVYEGVVRFGEITPSLDPDTEVNQRDDGFKLNPDALEDILHEFVGEIEQVPPAYSAKHVKGKRAYELARQGLEVTLEPKTVRVDSIELLKSEGNEALLRVTSGSGFYVRSLARDIAARLGTLGYLSELRRTQSGDVSIDNCFKLREILDSQPN